MLLSLFAMPVAAVSWTVGRGLGVDITLVVICTHSLLFAYLGRHTGASKYNVVAIVGFVSFLLTLFWTKLGLSEVNAYVIPVALGLLLLVQMAGDSIAKELRFKVRFGAMLAMLGSSGYYAILDSSNPLVYNLVLLLLGFLIMGVGSLLRIRLYLILGCIGIVADLSSIMIRAVMAMGNSYQMTVIGVLLLLVGICVVGGSVLYKTKREGIEEQMGRVRDSFSGWE